MRFSASAYGILSRPSELQFHLCWDPQKQTEKLQYTQRYEYMNHIEKNQRSNSLTCANYPEPQGMQIFWAPGSSPKSKKSSFIAKSQGGWDLKTSGHEKRKIIGDMWVCFTTHPSNDSFLGNQLLELVWLLVLRHTVPLQHMQSAKKKRKNEIKKSSWVWGMPLFQRILLESANRLILGKGLPGIGSRDFAQVLDLQQSYQASIFFVILSVFHWFTSMTSNPLLAMQALPRNKNGKDL